MSTLGDSAIALLVKGCAEPFAVLPMGTIPAQLPKRQVSSTNHRALVTKLVQRESPNHDVPQAFLQRLSHYQ